MRGRVLEESWVSCAIEKCVDVKYNRCTRIHVRHNWCICTHEKRELISNVRESITKRWWSIHIPRRREQSSRRVVDIGVLLKNKMLGCEV